MYGTPSFTAFVSNDNIGSHIAKFTEYELFNKITKSVNISRDKYTPNTPNVSKHFLFCFECV